MAKLSSVGAEARRLDSTRYLGALFAADPKRDVLWSLVALDAALGAVPFMVREPMLARIRLQWWREGLAAAAKGTPPAEPVLQVLADAMPRYAFDDSAFDAMLDAREREIDGIPPPDLAALEQRAAATAGVVALLGLRVLGATAPATCDAARHVAAAIELLRVAEGIPAHAALGRVAVPGTLSRDAGLDFSSLFAGRHSGALGRVVADLCDAARVHLAQARALAPGVERAALPVLLAAISLDDRLKTLGRAGYVPQAVPGVTSPWRVMRLVWAGLLGRY